MFGFDIFAIVFVALVVLTLFAGVKTVTQGYNWTVERFGRYMRTLSPGLNIIVPFIDRIGRKMNMMEQVIDIPQQEVISKDNATVTVDGVAFFQVFDAAKASYEVANLDLAIVTLTMTNIRSVMGAMDLDQVLSHRDEINERLLRVVLGGSFMTDHHECQQRIAQQVRAHRFAGLRVLRLTEPTE